MKIKGKIVDVIKDYGTNEYDVVFRTSEDVRESVDRYNNKELVIEYKQYRKQRSKEANRYMWHLINEIASCLGTTKDDVYLKLVQDYGIQYEIKLRKDINPASIFVYYKRIWITRKYRTYRVYVGTSHYDTKQMSVFLDGIIYEAKQLGIETMTPKQIAEWKGILLSEQGQEI